MSTSSVHRTPQVREPVKILHTVGERERKGVRASERRGESERERERERERMNEGGREGE